MASLGDIIQVVARMVFNTDITIENVYHVKVATSGGVDDADVITDMGEYLEDIYSNLTSAQSTSLEYVDYSCTNITVDLDLGLSGFPSLTAGSSGTEVLPTPLAGLVRARTATPGHEGRKFFGPFLDANNDEGYWTSALNTNLAAAGTDAYSPFTSALANDYTPVVLDRTTGEGRPVVEVVSTNLPAYQRRRKPGVGI